MTEGAAEIIAVGFLDGDAVGINVLGFDGTREIVLGVSEAFGVGGRVSKGIIGTMLEGNDITDMDGSELRGFRDGVNDCVDGVVLGFQDKVFEGDAERESVEEGLADGLRVNLDGE